MYVLFPISVRAALDLRDRYADKGGFGAVKIKLRLPTGELYGQTGQLNYVDNTVATNTDTLTLARHHPQPAPLRRASRASPAPASWPTASSSPSCSKASQPSRRSAIPRAAILSDQQGNYV